MKTLTEKYNGVLKGLFNESQFLRDARMEFPNLIHPSNNFKDAARILQSKGVIAEQADSSAVHQKIDASEYRMIKNIYKNTPKEKIPLHIQKRMEEFEAAASLEEEKSNDVQSVTGANQNQYKVVYAGKGFYNVHKGDKVVARDLLSKEEAEAYINNQTKNADEEKNLKEASQPIQLNVVFKDTEDYVRAKEWFGQESDFYPSSEHDEFQTLSFEVADQADADATEIAINQELQGSDIQSWSFELMEGIHDKNILSAPHTNIKTPPKGTGDYDPAARAASLKRLANLGPKKDITKEAAATEFKKGDKVTYLGHPAEITAVGQDAMDRTHYSVAYDSGKGRTKASNIYNKDGEIKAVVKEEIDPELLDVAQTAMRISKEEGVVQHVNQNPNGKGYSISDFYDADNTVISFENGRKLNETSNPCWDGYEMVGMKMKDGKEVPNCVPITENHQELKRNDVIRHIPSGVEMRVSVVKPKAVSGVITKAGNLSSKFKVGDVTQVKNVLIGATWEKVNESLQEEYEAPKAHIPLDVLDHGIRFELDKQGLGTDCTTDQYEKAKTKATKNLEKDLLFYKREEGAADMPVSKTDQMVKMKIKEGVKVLIKKILSENTAPKVTFTKNGKVR